MRRLVIVGMLAVLLGGCKKAGTKAEKPPEQPQGSDQGISVHGPTGVVLGTGSMGGGGGSGGAAQAVRKAVGRTATQNDLRNLQLFIDNASLASGRMPTIPEIAAVLQKEAPQTDKLLREEVIILTGIRQREGIWAYTKEPQTVDQHLVLTNSGIEKMTTEVLKQRLQQQGQ